MYPEFAAYLKVANLLKYAYCYIDTLIFIIHFFFIGVMVISHWKIGPSSAQNLKPKDKLALALATASVLFQRMIDPYLQYCLVKLVPTQ